MTQVSVTCLLDHKADESEERGCTGVAEQDPIADDRDRLSRRACLRRAVSESVEEVGVSAKAPKVGVAAINPGTAEFGPLVEHIRQAHTLGKDCQSEVFKGDSSLTPHSVISSRGTIRVVVATAVATAARR